MKTTSSAHAKSKKQKNVSFCSVGFDTVASSNRTGLSSMAFHECQRAACEKSHRSPSSFRGRWPGTPGRKSFPHNQHWSKGQETAPQGSRSTPRPGNLGIDCMRRRTRGAICEPFPQRRSSYSRTASFSRPFFFFQIRLQQKNITKSVSRQSQTSLTNSNDCNHQRYPLESLCVVMLNGALI